MPDKDTTTQWAAFSTHCPELAPHARLHDQMMGGALWYVLQNEATGEHARFNRSSNAIISRLDGTLSLAEILEAVNALPFVRCDENTLLQLMIKLQRMGALVGGHFIEPVQLRQSHEAMKAKNRYRRWLNPLAVKISLFDPDSFLERLAPRCNGLFTRLTLWVWGVIVSIALLCVAFNWSIITEEFSTRTLRLETLWWFALLYPALKFVHELAHAVCVKHWGGQVRDVGISLLLLIPVPYVDASDVYASHTRQQRLILTAAGMAVELLIASIAIVLWFCLAPGYTRDALFSVFVLGGLTTVLFNANPLLKFDGYYLLQDALDIPNLGVRSSQWLHYRFKQRVLGMPLLDRPVATPRESKWLMLYGIAVVVYRPLLTLIIVIFLWRTYPLLGAALAAFAIVNQWALPLAKSIRWMLQAPELTEQRSRALAMAFCAVCAFTALLLVPLPSSTRVQGIVAASEQGEVYSEADGFVTLVHVKPGDRVLAGAPLVSLESHELRRDLQQIASELLALNADRVANLRRTSATQSNDYASNLAEKTRLLSRQRELMRQRDAMTITAQQDGTFAPVNNDLLPGAFIAQGRRIGFVVSGRDWTVRTLVPETRAERLQSGVKSASVRLAEALENELDASVVKETPAVTRQLWSSALSRFGGGAIVTDPRDSSHRLALNNQFELELSLPRATTITGLGQRALVRLEHPPQALLSRLWHATRAVWMTRARA